MASPTCDYLIYYESLAYLIPRFLVWLALFALATVDGVLHRHIKRRGWQLHRGICVVIGAFVLQDILLLSYSIGKRTGLSTIDNVCKSFIFFADLADSLFIVSGTLLGPPNSVAQNGVPWFDLKNPEVSACCAAGSADGYCCWVLVSQLWLADKNLYHVFIHFQLLLQYNSGQFGALQSQSAGYSNSLPHHDSGTGQQHQQQQSAFVSFLRLKILVSILQVSDYISNSSYAYNENANLVESINLVCCHPTSTDLCPSIVVTRSAAPNFSIYL